MKRTKKAWAIVSRHGRLRAYLGFSDGNLRTLYEYHCAYLNKDEARCRATEEIRERVVPCTITWDDGKPARKGERS
jgi:hypothetical protein